MPFFAAITTLIGDVASTKDAGVSLSSGLSCLSVCKQTHRAPRQHAYVIASGRSAIVSGRPYAVVRLYRQILLQAVIMNEAIWVCSGYCSSGGLKSIYGPAWPR